jgi:hypothetical protein
MILWSVNLVAKGSFTLPMVVDIATFGDAETTASVE